MKYKILTYNTLQCLEDKVNSFIAAGYEPIGGITVVEVGSDERLPSGRYYKSTYYSQAVIKRNDNSTN